MQPSLIICDLTWSGKKYLLLLFKSSLCAYFGIRNMSTAFVAVSRLCRKSEKSTHVGSQARE